MYLHCHSWFSLRYGTLPPHQLVQQAIQHGIKALVLADINTTMGITTAIKAAQGTPLKIIAGIECRDPQHRLLYILIALNNTGFEAINYFISHHNLTGQPLPHRCPALPHTAAVYVWGNLHASLGAPVQATAAHTITTPAIHQPLSPHEYIGLPPHTVGTWAINPWLRQPSLASKLLFCHSVNHSNPTAFQLHTHLRAIHLNSLISTLSPTQLAHPQHTWLSPQHTANLRERFPSIAHNTDQLLDTCSLHFDFESNKNKKNFYQNPAADRAMLQSLCHAGLLHRYGPANIEYASARLKKELETIDLLGFNAYYLITHDVIRFAKSKGFYHVGRGSGANSIAAYCIGITDVDPLELDLYFERFLNPKRKSPPDFDIDFSWDQRDQIYDYIFAKYNSPKAYHAALLGTINTFQHRSITRELGKTYGLPKQEIDHFQDDPHHSEHHHQITAKIIDLLDQLHPEDATGHRQHFPNLLGIHAGGVLVSEEPITAYTTLHLPPKGYPTAQFDMYQAEDIHLEKLDVLSQRGIGHINTAVQLIQQNRGITVDVHQPEKFKKDPKINQQLRDAQTIGCFYIESPAMRQLLTKLDCTDYLTLVAASSIIRPGVSSSGMMQQYIQRHHDPSNIKYLHPVMKEQLQETHGVMVYQEDVMKICHHYAGMDLADADILRRAMSGKYRGSAAFQAIEDTFFQGAIDLNRPPEITAEIWRQVSSFAGYSFCKAHSASFAVESYQSLFLKTYYPLEFYTAVINNFGGFYQTWVYVHMAQLHGANVQLPCVNNSLYYSHLAGSTLWLGFIHIKGLHQQAAESIIAQRKQNGPFTHLPQLLHSSGMGITQLQLLIDIGALRNMGHQPQPKQQLHAAAHLASSQPALAQDSPALFEPETGDHNLPYHTLTPQQQAIKDAHIELQLLSFPLSLNHFSLLRTAYRGDLPANQLAAALGKTIRMVGKLVTYKTIRTRTGKAMTFGTFIDAEGQFFDTTHFPQVWQQYPMRSLGIYLIQGKVVVEFGHHSLEVHRLALLPLISPP